MDNEKFSPLCFFSNGSIFKNADLSSASNSSFAFTVANTEKFLSETLFKNKDIFSSFVQKTSERVSFRKKDESFKFDTVLFEGNDYKKAYIRGEITEVLECSSKCKFNGKLISLDGDSKAHILNNAEKFLSRGLNVIAYAYTANPEITLSSSHIIHKNLVFSGFFVCKKTLSDECDSFFDLCLRNDIQPVIFMTGNLENVKLSFSAVLEFALIPLQSITLS